MMWQCHLSSSECRCCLNGFSLCKRLPIPLSAGSRALEQSVGAWLAALGLQQYESRLLLNGFDDVRFLVSARRRGVAGRGSRSRCRLRSGAPRSRHQGRADPQSQPRCLVPFLDGPSALLPKLLAGELFASLHPKEEVPSPVPLRLGPGVVRRGPGPSRSSQTGVLVEGTARSLC